MTLEKRSHDTAPHPAKLSASDFWLLADSGAFANHARTELIDGEIWVVNSVHRWHARVMTRITVALSQAIGSAGLELEVLTAEFDLGRKAQLYARHGVPEYWVVHRDGHQLIQMWSPSSDGYAERREIAFGERMEAVTMDGLTIETSGI
jgi:Uma2 family endonuclease